MMAQYDMNDRTPEEREAIRRARNEYHRQLRMRNADRSKRYLDDFYLRKAYEYGFMDEKRPS